MQNNEIQTFVVFLNHPLKMSSILTLIYAYYLEKDKKYRNSKIQGDVQIV